MCGTTPTSAGRKTSAATNRDEKADGLPEKRKPVL
jgi:hypothetical protein